MTIPRRRRRSAARACTQTSRAPRKCRHGPAPAPIVGTRAFLRGRVPVRSKGLSLIGGPDPRSFSSQASNGGSFDALQRPDDR